MSPASRLFSEEIALALDLVAPGTELRLGIENIIRAQNGALIVIARAEKLEELNIVTGGMKVDLDFTPMRLYELAKMDGAIVVSPNLSVIHYANVHLNPDPTLVSDETGMRHLAASRTAKQTGDLVIAVSERRKIVSLYQGQDGPHVLEDIGVVLNKANSALATLDKFMRRLQDESRILTIHEYDGGVSLREVVGIIGTFEYSVRIADEVQTYVRELGSEGRLVSMQLGEAFLSVPRQYDALLRDYVGDDTTAKEVRSELRKLSSSELSDTTEIARILGYGSIGQIEDHFLTPRGFRQLAQVPRLPRKVSENLIEEFHSLEGLLDATEEALDEVDGVGQARARAIQRVLRRQRRIKPLIDGDLAR